MRGSRLKTAREAMGLSQDDLAELANTNIRQIGRWERGETKPDGETIGRLAIVLNVTTDYLIGLTDNPNPQGYSEGLSHKERLAIAAWRHGDYKQAIKTIVADE